MEVEGKPVRCVIVDDNREFAVAASRMLQHDGVVVVGVATTGAEALRCLHDLRPDVMLVDIDLGTESGFDVAEQLHSAALPTPPRLVLISTHNEEDLADLIATSPAVGFVAKVGLSADAVRVLMAGLAHS